MQATERSFLIVDGSPAVRHQLRRMLTSLGFPEGNVETVGSGSEGVDAYEEVDPDLVLLDLDLADEEGELVPESILRGDPSARVVVTTCSRLGEQEQLKEAIRMGVFDVVEKPIRKRNVTDILRRLADECEGVDRIA